MDIYNTKNGSGASAIRDGIKTKPLIAPGGSDAATIKNIMNSFCDEATEDFGVKLMDGKNVKIWPWDK